MLKNFIDQVKQNKLFSFIKQKIKDISSFFHIPTILGHGVDENNPKQKSKAAQKIDESFSKAVAKFDNIYENLSEKEAAVISDARGPLKFGLTLILLFFGIFFGWMVFAKIDGSVVAQGQVVFAQNKQNVQHQSGGTIKSVLVREGDIVHLGQTLMILNDADVRANYNMTYNKLAALKATESRLISEREYKDTIEFPKDLIKESQDDKDLKDILKSQERLFDANNHVFTNKIQIIADKKKQFENEIQSIESQRNLANQKIQYIEEQIRNTETLLKEGNASKVRLLDLKSQRDSFKQELQRLTGSISNYSSQMNSLQEEELITRNTRLKEIEDNLKEIGISIASEQEKLNAIDDNLKKNVIKSPINGVVNNLRYKNSGEVIQPSSTIMEIVPNNDYLIVEAKLMAKEINSLLNSGFDLLNYNHQDINHLLDAKINLVSYSSRRYKKLKGSVFYVAADAATDQRYGYTYYLLKVMISKKELEIASKKNMKLFPGMPAEVYVLTEPRTPFSYFISPITSSLDKAFIDS
jgi:HlyD family secretion protein